jgi:FtsP/CotA-like multicopper oxidase with cupredoxin domain
MALSLSNFLLPISLLASIAQCATVKYDFDIAWTYANPDGQFRRPVMGINGKWPIEPIVATKGDQVIVNVKNSLGNESTSLHFHGLYQNGTTHMDGPVQVSQCGIPPGSSFTYNFTVRTVSLWRITNSHLKCADRFCGNAMLTDFRLTKLGLTGTTATSAASIQTACAVL